MLRGTDTIVVLVLVVLRDGASHGYEIAREVERRSGDALSFKYGTLYPILHSLEKEGMITGEWEHPQGERRSRRVYSLTEQGLVETEKALKTWETFASAVNRVIQGVPREQAA
ncbi:MAG: helix-turn-helix transcriptional regulator [Cytophagales bacterium]|nr:helix-turn-helix transcriptional regulator [Armatimonadota bacterium]